MANNPTVIEKYFNLLEDTIRSNGLTQRPGQIFNCDETGLSLSHKPPKVVVKAGQKHPYAVTSGNKAQITVLACASASGYTIPPMIIFDRKSLSSQMIQSEVPDTFYGLSDSGWMDSTLFEEWFKSHFLRHAPAARPLLLLLDGHCSHYNPSVLRMARDEQVILFCLPPHTTHLLQPLDNGIFSSLKDNWRKECQAFFNANPGKVLNRHNFNEVFRPSWVKGMAISNVIGCFRLAGVYPMDRNIILSQLQADDDDSTGHNDSAPHVPFCTPRKGTGPSQESNEEEPIQIRSPDIRSLQKQLVNEQSQDPRHALWLATFFPQAGGTTSQNLTDPLEKILKRPTPPSCQEVKKYQPTACVLTSEQFINQMEQKAEQKKKMQEQKEHNRKERERKRQEKEAWKLMKTTRKGKKARRGQKGAEKKRKTEK